MIDVPMGLRKSAMMLAEADSEVHSFVLVS